MGNVERSVPMCTVLMSPPDPYTCAFFPIAADLEKFAIVLRLDWLSSGKISDDPRL